MNTLANCPAADIAEATPSVKPSVSREDQLVMLARTRFGVDKEPATQAEEVLFRAIARGQPADFGNKSDKDNDPAHPENWGSDRTIRADRLAWVCTDRDASALVGVRGVVIVGALITNDLDLAWAELSFPLRISKCACTGKIILESSHLRDLSLSQSHIKGLDASGLNVSGDVAFQDGFKSNGPVKLTSAKIGVLAEINTRAAKSGLEPADLIDQVLEQARRKSRAYWQEMMATARAVDEALALGISELWPERFEDRLVVGVLLSMWQKQSSETLLLETSGPKMDAIEETCRAEGISYEEFTRRAIDAKLHGENTEDEDDQDEADWWKKEKPE